MVTASVLNYQISVSTEIFAQFFPAKLLLLDFLRPFFDSRGEKNLGKKVQAGI